MRLLLILCLVLSARASTNVGVLRQSLLQTDRAFARRSVEQGAKPAFQFYLTDDAVRLPPANEAIVGRAKVLESIGDGYVLDWEPMQAEVAQSGDLGYTFGIFVVKNARGDTVRNWGKYLNVWKRQADGAWKLHIDMGNGSPFSSAAEFERLRKIYTK